MLRFADRIRLTPTEARLFRALTGATQLPTTAAEYNSQMQCGLERLAERGVSHPDALAAALELDYHVCTDLSVPTRMPRSSDAPAPYLIAS